MTANQRLPVEILRKIINHLDHETDRHTLATCMRVSPIYNALSAPLLYRAISIGSVTAANKGVLHSVPPLDGQSPRISLDKATCLTYVKELEVIAHEEEDCPYAQCDSLKEVDVLRISLITPKRPNKQWSASAIDHLSSAISSCFLIKSISAGKVVLFNTPEQTIRLPKIPQGSLHTITTAFPYISHAVKRNRTPPLVVRPIAPFEGSNAASKQLVHVFWDQDPPCTMQRVCAELDRLGIDVLGYRNTRNRQVCASLVHVLVRQAMGTDYPSDIIVVNIDGILAHGSEWPTPPTHAVSESPATTTYWKNHIEQEIIALSNQPGTKSPEDARKINIKYISMQTYLEDYDWRGEFTQDEVKDWYSPLADGRRAYVEAELIPRAAM